MVIEPNRKRICRLCWFSKLFSMCCQQPHHHKFDFCVWLMTTFLGRIVTVFSGPTIILAPVYPTLLAIYTQITTIFLISLLHFGVWLLRLLLKEILLLDMSWWMSHGVVISTKIQLYFFQVTIFLRLVFQWKNMMMNDDAFYNYWSTKSF